MRSAQMHVTVKGRDAEHSAQGTIIVSGDARSVMRVTLNGWIGAHVDAALSLQLYPADGDVPHVVIVRMPAEKFYWRRTVYLPPKLHAEQVLALIEDYLAVLRV